MIGEVHCQVDRQTDGHTNYRFCSRKEKYQELQFPCPQLCHTSAGVWHHVVLQIQAKGLRGKAKATLFMDGQPLGSTQKVCECISLLGRETGPVGVSQTGVL